MRTLIASIVAITLPVAALAAAEHGTDAHADAHAPGLPQLDVTTYPSQLFWLAVTFVVLYVVFARWTLPALSAILESRTQHIQADLAAAAELKKKAEEVQASYEASLADARAEASALFASMGAQAKTKAREAQDTFRKESADRFAEVEVAITRARTEALEAMEAQADALAQAAADKLLEDKVA